MGKVYSMAVMAYEIALIVDGEEHIIVFDDTYPSVSDWESATIFAMHLVLRQNPNSDIELLYNKDYPSEEYAEYGYIHEAPIRIQ